MTRKIPAMFPFSRSRRSAAPYAGAVYLLAAVAAGVSGGLAGTAFHLGVDTLSGQYRELRLTVTDPVLSGVMAAVISALAALLAALIVRRIAPEAAGSGIQEVEGAMEGCVPCAGSA
ncbi:hypothetical protein V6L77_16340 [Pannonibacter sp. Pt2-lr]